MVSAWLAFRLSVWLERPILVKSETPAYVLGIVSVAAICFTVGMWLSIWLLGLRVVRQGGQMMLIGGTDRDKGRSE
jgi:hypothetical protein